MAARLTRKDSSLFFCTIPQSSGTSADQAFRMNVFHPKDVVSGWSRERMGGHGDSR